MTEAVPSQVSRRALMRGLGLLTLASGTMSPVRAAARLRVVASFSILYDMVRQVGGGRVDVTALVGPDSDAHVFNPTPADVRAVASADIFLVNGLSFEGWLGRLEQASRTRARVVHATQGVKRRLIRGTHDGHADDHGDGHAHDHDHSPRPGGEAVDPHAWQSLVNGQVYVRNIEAALAATDRANAPYFAERARTYRAELETLHAQARARLARVPPQYRRIVDEPRRVRLFRGRLWPELHRAGRCVDWRRTERRGHSQIDRADQAREDPSDLHRKHQRRPFAAADRPGDGRAHRRSRFFGCFVGCGWTGPDIHQDVPPQPRCICPGSVLLSRAASCIEIREQARVGEPGSRRGLATLQKPLRVGRELR